MSPATRNNIKRRRRVQPYETVREAVVKEYETTAAVLDRERREAAAAEAAKITAISAAEKAELATGWRILNLSNEHVEWDAPPVGTPYLSFAPAPTGKPSALDAWCAVVGPEFYTKLVNFHKTNATPINYPSGNAIEVTPEHALLYHGLRFELMAATDGPRKTDTLKATHKQLRNKWEQLLKEYKTKYPKPKTNLGINALEALHARFVVPVELEPYINTNLLNLIACAGEAIAGDEKAFGGYHEAETMKCAKDKQPGDQIGQWYNTMCARTRWGKSFLFRIRLFRAARRLGITDPPALMSEEMAQTLASVGSGVLVTDSLYMTQHTAMFWRSFTAALPSVRFLASVDPKSFQPIIRMVKEERYKTPGQYVVLWNEEHHECFQINRPVASPTDIKYTYSNTFRLVNGAADPHQNPMYRVYNLHYGQCDMFNRNMGGKALKFMHRRGSSLAARDDFYITALLMDAWIMWEHFNSPEGHLVEKSFSEFLLALSSDIYAKVNTKLQ